MSGIIEEKPIICLVGAVRSGTTLLRLMLDHHPDIAFQKEFEYAVEKIQQDGKFPPIYEYIEWLKTDRIFHIDGYEINPSYDYKTLINSFLKQKKNYDGKMLVGATIHYKFDLIKYLWPNALYIYLLRDGRDVARSIIQMGWAGNMWTASRSWVEAESLWDSVKKKLKMEQWIEVRYEDLILDTDRVLQDICRFIGVKFSDRMYEYVEKSTYSKPDSKLIYQWKRKLTIQQIQLAEARMAEILLKRQYKLSDYPFTTVGKLKRFILHRQDWLYRLQFRVKRNGLRLTLLDFISRRLRFHKLEVQTRHRLHVITNAHLK